MRIALAAMLVLSFAFAAVAATKEQAEAAVADAIKAEDMAAKAGNKWLPAETALKAARAALAAASWDQAAAQAMTAKALAVRAVEQAREQETAWHDAVIR
jgi:hypothetical protein